MKHTWQCERKILEEVMAWQAPTTFIPEGVEVTKMPQERGLNLGFEIFLMFLWKQKVYDDSSE